MRETVRQRKSEIGKERDRDRERQRKSETKKVLKTERAGTQKT